MITKNKVVAIILALLTIDMVRLLAVALVASTMVRPERHIIVVDQDGAGGAAETRLETFPELQGSFVPSNTPTPVPELVSGLSGNFLPAVEQWGIWITVYANQYSIDPNMVAAVMTQESGGQQNATSTAGAQGLMQVMPFHSCATYEPEKNIACGVHLLSIFRQKAPDWRSALAAYNAGEKGRDDGKGWGYADKVLAIYERNK